MPQREPKIDLMLIDFAMPGMSGADVARNVHTTKPAMPTLFITGCADHRALRGVGETHIIGKPFTPDELAYKVCAALAESGGSVWLR
jgi:DNA-binding response OmpR family regulator